MNEVVYASTIHETEIPSFYLYLLNINKGLLVIFAL